MEDADEPALAAEVAPFISSISTPLKNTSITARVDHQFGPMHNASVVYQARAADQLATVWRRQSARRSPSGSKTQFRCDLVFRHVCLL